MPEREQSRSSACKARKSTTPLGTRCGRREREANHERIEEQSSDAHGCGGGRRPVRKKPSPFAGWQQAAGLGRFDHVHEVLHLTGGRAGDSGLPRGRREGERRRYAPSKRMHPTRARPAKPLAHGDTSFARSSDPCTSIVTPLCRRKPTEVTRRGRYRGRANLSKGRRNRHRDRPRRTMRGSPRVTAS